MTLLELSAQIIQILPNATYGEDNDGQLIIYTDLMQTGPDDQPLEPLTLNDPS